MPLQAVEPDVFESEESVETSPTVVEEDVSRRTENSKHYVLSDGSYRAEIHNGPIHYRSDGRWDDIETRFVRDLTPGTFRSKATPATVKVNAQTGGKRPVRVERDGWAFEIDMLGTVESAPVSLGNKARFLNVAKNTDLEYEVLSGGLKETVILSSADAPTTFTFEIKLDGLELRQIPGGPVALFELGANEPTLYLGELVVFDSSENGAGDPAYCIDSEMRIDSYVNRAVLTYSISESWLKDPARVFPVNVDPTFYASEDTFISSKYPTTTYGGSTELKVGYYDSTTGHNRALVKFNTSSIPSNAYVASASFRAYMFHQYYTNTATPVYVGRVTSAWSNATTWNLRPSHVALGTQSVTGRGVWVAQGCTATVQNWLRGTWANHGFSLYQKEDGSQNQTHWKKFYSREAGTTYDPQLIVDYSIPTDQISGYTSSYRMGDTVTAQMLVYSPSWSQVREMRMLVNHSNGNPRRGYLAWFTYDPGGSWITRKLSDTSYLAYLPGSTYGTDRIVPDLAASTVGSSSTSNYRRVTWKFKVGTNFGDVQQNDLDTYFTMNVPGGDPYIRTWKNNDTNINIRPTGLSSPPVLDAQPSVKWFRETDRDGDGKPDVMNDFDGQGRGDVTVSWKPTPVADGYHIYLKDGKNFRRVGTTLGNGSTTWSTRNSQAYPRDSAVAGWPASNDGNPFVGATTPSAQSRVRTLSVSGQPSGTDPKGTGVVLTDNGTNYYVRTWSTYAGATRWGKYSRDGKWLSWVGPDLASKPILSAFLQDQVIYNGYADTPTRVTGYSIVTGAATTLTFSKPLLRRDTGAELTAASNSVILAGDGNRIYSVAYGMNGTVYAGYTIREYDRTGAWIRDKKIPTKSFYIDGAIAVETDKASGALYLIEWGGKNRILKLDAKSLDPVNEWTSDQASTRIINGCWDPSKREFVLGTLDQGKLQVYSGPGLALRDNPNGLYRKTAPTTHGERTDYEFVVVPYDDYAGEATFAENATSLTAIDNRTVSVNDDPRHTSFDLDEILTDSATIELDSGALTLENTDLDVTSWGPDASLSRYYSSADAEAGVFVRGWRFDFERRLSLHGDGAVYLDESGDWHSFRIAGGAYHGPIGYHAELEKHDPLIGATTYTLHFKDRSFLTFDQNGYLIAETDKNGQSTTYSYAPNPQSPAAITITAANGKSIVVEFDAAGRIYRASYGAGGVTREVHYSVTGAEGEEIATVTFYPGQADEFSVRYTYGGGRIVAIEMPGKTFAGVEPRWDVSYASGAGKVVDLTAPAHGEGPRPVLGVDYHKDPEIDLDRATITRSGEVDGTVQEIVVDYAWNPTGTLAYRTDDRVTGQPEQRWTYGYSSTNEPIRETAPSGKTLERLLDVRGNVEIEYDEDHHVTAYQYDGFDQVKKKIDPRGNTTYYDYSPQGNLTSERRLLEIGPGGEMRYSETGYEYDSYGRRTFERTLLEGDRWSATKSGYAGAPADQPTTVTQVAQIKSGSSFTDSPISLGGGATVASIVSETAYDAFGNVTLQKDANGLVTFSDAAYSTGGKLTRSRDVEGVLTENTYDALGRLTETKSTVASNPHGPAMANWNRTRIDPEGRTVREESLAANGAVNTWTEYRYDALGRKTRTIDSVAGTSATWYNARGHAVATWEPDVWDEASPDLEKATRAVYDVDGRDLRAIDAGKPDSAAILKEYRADGLLLKLTQADGSWVSYEYDEGGNQTAEVAPTETPGVFARAEMRYDEGGRLIESESAEGMITRTYYDRADRPIKVVSVESDGEFEFETIATESVFNELGWEISTTDADEVLKQSQYDALGNVVQEKTLGKGGAVVTTVDCEYDAKKRLKKKSTAEQGGVNVVQYDYDPFGRVVAEDHTKAGSLSKSVRTKYDEYDRETRIEDLKRGIVRQYDYAGAGKKKSIENLAYGSVETAVTFDELDRETTSMASFALAPSAVEVSRALVWNGAKNLPVTSTLKIGPGSWATGYAYDDGDKLTSITGGMWGSGGVSVEYNEAAATKKNDTVTLPWGGVTTRSFEYTTAGRLARADVSPSRSILYTWDEAGTGNLEMVVDNGVPTNLTYAGGQIATLARGGGGALTTFGFDGAGRRELATTPGVGSQHMTWTGEDRLATWTRKDAAGATVSSAAYAYDGDGQRVSASVTAPSPWSTAAVETAYTYGWDGLELRWVQARSADVTATLTYLYDESDRPFAAAYTADRSGETSSAVFGLLLTDHGDVVGLVDASGEQFARYAYGPFGEAEEAASRATGALDAALAAEITAFQSLRYASYNYDTWSETYYLQARYYDPATRQFLTKDPAEADGEESAYQYCAGDPVNQDDPDGEFAQVLWGAVGGAAWYAGEQAIAGAWKARSVFKKQGFKAGMRATWANTKKSWSWKAFGGSVALGAATGGLGMAAKSGKLATVGAKAATGARAGRCRVLTSGANRAIDRYNKHQLQKYATAGAKKWATKQSWMVKNHLVGGHKNLVTHPKLGAAMRGHAIESYVRNRAARNVILQKTLVHGARNRGADFVHKSGYSWYDVTTRASRAKHFRRGYGPHGRSILTN